MQTPCRGRQDMWGAVLILGLSLKLNLYDWRSWHGVLLPSSRRKRYTRTDYCVCHVAPFPSGSSRLPCGGHTRNKSHGFARFFGIVAQMPKKRIGLDPIFRA